MTYFAQLAGDMLALTDAARSAGRVWVLGHARPDGDCVGSQLALTRLWRQLGVDAAALNVDAAPQTLSFLVGDTPFERLERRRFDGRPLVFVDCADEKRVGMEASAWIEGQNYLGNIDHHISNTSFAQFNLVESQSAATCEILAGLAFDLNWTVDAATAQALLAGIMTDTGRFGYVATTSRVFQLCGRLVECGARPHLISQSLYDNESFARLKLMQRFLGALRVEHGGRLGVGILERRDFEETGASYEETEGFVDFARAIRGAKIGLYLEERQSLVKASLRAETADYRVDLLAKRFGGGGHACAAAFTDRRPLAEVEQDLIASLGAWIDQAESGALEPVATNQ